MATATDTDRPKRTGRDELRRSVERQIRTEHPLAWETFEAYEAEYLARHGTVWQSAADDGWYVACDDHSDDEGMFCAHAGPFESEAAAWERLDALRAVPEAVLLAWQEMSG